MILPFRPSFLTPVILASLPVLVAPPASFITVRVFRFFFVGNSAINRALRLLFRFYNVVRYISELLEKPKRFALCFDPGYRVLNIYAQVSASFGESGPSSNPQ